MNEFDVVRLKMDIPESNLKKGMKGAIVMVFNTGKNRAYEVEFVDSTGRTIGLVTINEECLEKVPF